MSVICFSSLKGGVGKTSLSVNVAHAFAARGCETLLIDLDPTSHTTRLFFRDRKIENDEPNGLVKTLLSFSRQQPTGGILGILELASALGIRLTAEVREQLSLIPGGDELRYLLWGNGGKAFASLFPRLVKELQGSFDQIVIDTPPDFNVLTRNALACADLAVVPLDSSAMSIDCLDQLLDAAAHLKGPQWAVVRTLVDRRSRKVQELSQARLKSTVGVELSEKDKARAAAQKSKPEAAKKAPAKVEHAEIDLGAADSPVYLLRSLIHRTEIQNRLSFVGQTSFDLAFARGLADEYLAVARELEDVITAVEESSFTEASPMELLSPQVR